jgi:hypothetical protein
MGGFAVQQDSQLEGPPRTLRPVKLLEMFRNNTLPWPKVSDDDIKDKSKADWIIKSLAIIQILWFATQMIGRWAQGLGTTTLELFTLGIVVAAVVIYVCNWERPFDVQMPIVIYAKDSVRIREEDCVSRVKWLSYVVWMDNEDLGTDWSWYVAIAICLVFGALHVAAWNFHFPSFTERLLWRISSVGVTVIPVVIVVIFDWLSESQLKGSFTWIAALFYTLFRLYMFVEMFASLREVPASVYQTPQWSQYFPSFG